MKLTFSVRIFGPPNAQLASIGDRCIRSANESFHAGVAAARTAAKAGQLLDYSRYRTKCVISLAFLTHPIRDKPPLTLMRVFRPNRTDGGDARPRLAPII